MARKKLFLKYPNNIFYEAYNRNSLFKADEIEFTSLSPQLKQAFVYSMVNDTHIFTPDEIIVLTQIYNENKTDLTVAKMLHTNDSYVNRVRKNALDKIYSIILIVSTYKDEGVNIVKLLADRNIESSNPITRKHIRYLPLYYLESIMSARLYNRLVDSEMVCLNELQFTSYDLIGSTFGIGEKTMLELDELMSISDLLFKKGETLWVH